jgi:hypothetical protein
MWDDKKIHVKEEEREEIKILMFLETLFFFYLF